MRVFTPRRSCARSPANPFRVPQPSILVEHGASAIAFALMLASWAVAYVAIVPADPAPAHHIHIATTR